MENQRENAVDPRSKRALGDHRSSGTQVGPACDRFTPHPPPPNPNLVGCLRYAEQAGTLCSVEAPAHSPVRQVYPRRRRYHRRGRQQQPAAALGD